MKIWEIFLFFSYFKENIFIPHNPRKILPRPCSNKSQAIFITETFVNYPASIYPHLSFLFLHAQAENRYLRKTSR
jgi:hypothetical protein